MEERDVVVVGAGISGLAFAWHAARSGARPLVLESSDRAGGCLDSRQGSPGYWFEMGAHTLYNSYGGLLEVADGCATPPTFVPRAPARKRFGLLRDGQLTTMGPLSVLARFGFWELVTHVPRALFASKEGKSTQDYYGRLVGPRNYQSVLAPFLAAVPSQDVGGFPAGGAGSLFKTRARRKEVPRSFTFDGGVGAVAAAIVASGVEVAPKSPVVELRRRGAGFEIRLEDGRRIGAPVVALAVDAATAARLLGPDYPELAGVLARVGTVSLDSVGVVVRKEEVALPELAFVVPVHDLFWSVVTRDPVPDATWRAFTFHFRPGHDRDARLRRVEEVLGTRAIVHTAERSSVLPSPALGHGDLVADVDRLLAGTRLALTGNYFAGLAIEDCVQRAKAEWARVAPPRA